MREFDYHEPASVSDAVAILRELGDDCHVIAGGTALVLLLKQGLIRPKHLVGLRSISSLRGIRPLTDGGVEIGGMTVHREVETSSVIGGYCGALAAAFASIGSIRIRNQGTIGGNLAHADPAQDPPPVLIAIGAEAVVEGPSGQRTVPLEALFVDFLETTIQPDEILVSVRLPRLDPGLAVTYLKFVPNTRDDYATVAIALALKADPDGVCGEVRIAVGGAGPTPMRASSVESALRGQRLRPALLEEAAAEIAGDIDPISDARGSAAYKRDMARVWVKRALQGLISDAPPPAGVVPVRVPGDVT